MATFADIQAKVAALQPTVGTLAQNIQAYITAQQAGGTGGIDPTQLQAVSDEVDQIQATVTQANSLITAALPPAAPATPPPAQS